MNGQFDIGNITPSRYFFAIAALLGLLFSMITGDDENALHPLATLLQWQIQTVGPMAVILGCHMLLARLSWFESRGPWQKLLLSGIAGGSLFSPLALATDVLLAGEPLEHGLTAAWLDELAGVLPPAVLCWIAINAPWVLGFRLEYRGQRARLPAASRTEEDSSGFDDNLPPPHISWTFMEKVPPSGRGRLIYLKAELHYLLVVTDAGKSLVLHNLRDAIEEMGEDIGFQPHRSFWIANGSVQRFNRRGRQGELEVVNGDRIPVSRRKLDQVAAILSKGKLMEGNA